MHNLRERVIHKTHEAAHLSYLGLVFIEGHGLYAYAAATLFVAHGCQIWYSMRKEKK